MARKRFLAGSAELKTTREISSSPQEGGTKVNIEGLEAREGVNLAFSLIQGPVDLKIALISSLYVLPSRHKKPIPSL